MLPVKLNELSRGDFDRLAEDQVSESSTLDFKLDLYERGEKGRMELCKDICAFANSFGGDLVFGVASEYGIATRVLGFTEDIDSTRRRIVQALDHIEPRLRGVTFEGLSIGQRNVFVVRVNKSYDGPHSFKGSQTVGGSSFRRYVFRDGTDTRDMDYQQIQIAYGLADSLIERAHNFISKRLVAIKNRQTPRRIYKDLPIAVIHLAPTSSFSSRASIDLNYWYENFPSLLITELQTAATRAFNLDGIIAYQIEGDGGCAGYTQAFRNGCIEMAFVAGNTRSGLSIPGIDLSIRLCEGLHAAMYIALASKLEGPAIISISLLNTQSFEFSNGEPTDKTYLSDRIDIIIPPLWIEDLHAPKPLAQVGPDLLDTLWQSFSLQRCVERITSRFV